MSYQILLFCEWFWHAVCQPESLLAYSLTSEYTVTFFFKSIDKHYFNVFFYLLLFLSVGISRVCHFKKLRFCTLTSIWIAVSSIIDLLQLLLILLLLLFWFYASVYEDTNCSNTSLNATGIRVLPQNFRIFSPFPSLVPTVRLLGSFLLPSWWPKLLTALGNPWLHKNRLSANPYQSQMYLSSKYLFFQ